jgi:uncharacterized Zn-binding protein involved in type VI secretion
MRSMLAAVFVAAGMGFAIASASDAPAARVGDATVAGTILPPGAPTVLICGKPAARAGDLALSAGQAPAPIIGGSPTVLIGGKPAARVGDSMANGAKIAVGCPTVLIGP